MGSEAAEASAYDSYWPLLAAFSGGLLFAGIAFRNWILLLIGLATFVGSVGGWIAHGTSLSALEGHLRRDRSAHILAGLSTNKMGMWIFLASEILFFTGLIGGSLALRAQSADWAEPGEVLNVPLTAVNTFILICSSLTMVEALKSVQRGNQLRMKVFLMLTMFLGLVFLMTQASEFAVLWNEGLRLDASPVGPATYGSTFYVQTGFHGAHVTAGVIALGVVNARAIRGRYTEENHESIELMGLYWHFVDVVWIFLFTIVYLI